MTEERGLYQSEGTSESRNESESSFRERSRTAHHTLTCLQSECWRLQIFSDRPHLHRMSFNTVLTYQFKPKFSCHFCAIDLFKLSQEVTTWLSHKGSALLGNWSICGPIAATCPLCSDYWLRLGYAGRYCGWVPSYLLTAGPRNDFKF